MDILLKENNIFYNIFCVFIAEHNKFDQKEIRLYWRSVFHSVALAHHGCVAAYAQGMRLAEHPDPRIQDMQRHGPRFLTGWNFAFQTIFLVLALAADAAEWCNWDIGGKMAKVRYWRDTIFCSLVVPYTLFVSGMFWGLFFLDRELVFPAAYDTVIPAWFNRAVHSWVLLVVALEMLLQPRRRPSDQTLQYALCCTFSVMYAVVYYTTYYQIGRWLYPVFGIMSWWQICLYQLAIWASMHLFYELQWPLVRIIHAEAGESNSTAAAATPAENIHS